MGLGVSSFGLNLGCSNSGAETGRAKKGTEL